MDISGARIAGALNLICAFNVLFYENKRKLKKKNYNGLRNFILYT
jgi:hypothetical protein